MNNENAAVTNSSEQILHDTGVIDGEVIGSNPLGNQVLPMSLSTLDSSQEKKGVSLPRKEGVLPLAIMLDVPFTLTFEVGRTNITIKQLMELREGAFIELRNVSVDSIEVRINDHVIAHAEIIALQQRYGIRFGEVETMTNLEKENHNV